jgi:hypothetical protein
LPALFFAAAPVRAQAGDGPPQPAPLPDPAASLLQITLNEEDARGCRALLAKLGSENAGERAEALRRLFARGPAVLPLAEEFARNANAETAARACELRDKLLRDYDGPWPDSPELLKSLAKLIPVPKQKGLPAALFRALAEETGIRHLASPELEALRKQVVFESLRQELPVRELLQTLARAAGCTLVMRGEWLLAVPPETAEKLKLERGTLDWKALGLDRDEARRVSQALAVFLPPGAETGAGSEVLTVRGPKGSVIRAARLVALLGAGAGPACWPAPEKPPDLAAIVAELSKPVSLTCENAGLEDVLAAVRRKGGTLHVSFGSEVLAAPPYPQELRKLAPLTITFTEVPLGLVLRWLGRRAVVSGGERGRQVLHPWVDERGRLGLGLDGGDATASAVGGVDAGFLAPAESAPGEKSDAATQTRIARLLSPYLELFPGFDVDNDLRVLRGRLLVQGSFPAVARALQLVRTWRTSGRPPVCPWMEQLQMRLGRNLEWDGRELTAATLLKKLRELSGVSILLEGGADGLPPVFRLTPEQCELKPPGTYDLRSLLDQLAVHAKAKWELRWGAVVLLPAQ